MAKTNAERQREYHERKKAKEGLKYLEKERAGQERNYVKVKDLSKEELKERKKAVKLRAQKHRLSTKQLLGSSACNASIIPSTNSPPTLESSPFLVAMSFSK